MRVILRKGRTWWRIFKNEKTCGWRHSNHDGRLTSPVAWTRHKQHVTRTSRRVSIRSTQNKQLATLKNLTRLKQLDTRQTTLRIRTHCKHHVLAGHPTSVQSLGRHHTDVQSWSSTVSSVSRINRHYPRQSLYESKLKPRCDLKWNDAEFTVGG